MSWRGSSTGFLPPTKPSGRGRGRGEARGKSRVNTSWRTQDTESGESAFVGQDSSIIPAKYGSDPRAFGTPAFVGGSMSNLDPFGDILEPVLAQEQPMKGISTLDILGEDSDSRRKRFESTLSHNRYLELKPLREIQRVRDIKNGLIPDPLKPMRLEEAKDFVGTCMEMCPEWEREEREYQKSVEIWERYPGTQRIDPNIAVKAFHRPAAGNEQPLPSDVRPPKVLLQTLDYLFHVLLPSQPLHLTHPFLRDRTRSVRQDLTMQNERGAQAIECNERIARYHIMVIGMLRGTSTFSESQELEQLRKVLKSLNEFYDDARELNPPLATPNESEFRSYNILTHLRDPDIIWSTELLPSPIFDSPLLQIAIRLHSLAQLANIARGERVTLNAWSRFFKLLEQTTVPFLFSCILSTYFNEIRLGALKSLKSAYIPQFSGFPLKDLTKILGCDDETDTGEFCERLGMNVGSEVVEIHKNVILLEITIPAKVSMRLVEAKKGLTPYPTIIDGKAFTAAARTSNLLPSAQAFVPSRPFLPAQALKAPPLKQSIPSKLSSTSFASSAFPVPASSAFTSSPFSVPSSRPPPFAAPTKQSSPSFSSAFPSTVPANNTFQLPVSTPYQPIPSTSAIPIPANVRKSLSIPINLQKVSVPLPSPVRGPNRAKYLEKVIKDLTNDLIEQGVQNSVRRIAEQSLKENWVGVRKREERERGVFVTQLSGSLMKQVMGEFVGVSVREICWKEVKGLERKRAVFGHWRNRLENQNRRRVEAEEKLEKLRAIGLGKGKGRELDEDVSELEFGSLAIGIKSGSKEGEERLKKQFQEAQLEIQQLWSAGTFLHLSAQKIEELLDLESKEIERCKFGIIISTADTSVTFSTWLACKFELDEAFSIALDTSFAEMEVEMIENRLSNLNKSCGIIIFDCTSAEIDSEATFWDKSRLRLKKLIDATSDSIYKPNLLVFSCSTGQEKSEESNLCERISKELALDSFDIGSQTVSIVHLESAEQEFKSLLDRELKSLNRKEEKILIPASKYYGLLLAPWSTSLAKIMKPTLETDSAITIASELIEVLNEVNEETVTHISTKPILIKLPAFPITSIDCLAETIATYISAPAFDSVSHFPVIQSLLQSRPIPVPASLLRLLLQHLAEFLPSKFDLYRIEQGAFETLNGAVLRITNRLEIISNLVKEEPKKKRKASPDHRGHGKKQSISEINIPFELSSLSRLNSLIKDVKEKLAV